MYTKRKRKRTRKFRPSHRLLELSVVHQRFANELYKRLPIITSFIVARTRVSDVPSEFLRGRSASGLRDGNPSSESGLVPTWGPKQTEKTIPLPFHFFLSPSCFLSFFLCSSCSLFLHSVCVCVCFFFFTRAA